MKANFIVAALLAGAIVLPAAEISGRPGNAAAAFAQLKTLAGEWEADTQMGKSHLAYEVVANGSAVVERETIHDSTMLTVYTLDGDRLLLTHYCMAGNQPRMQARGLGANGELAFDFLDATSLSPGGGHMHNATLRFIDGRHFSAAWQFYENGKAKFTETMEYTRIR